MLEAHDNLSLSRCPHCRVAKPLLNRQHKMETRDHSGQIVREWYVYACSTCGGVVVASVVNGTGRQVAEVFPSIGDLDDAIPERARSYLKQARDSLHAPAGAVMLAASAVDAMLKEKGFKTGSLYQRIDKAAEDHAITSGMAAWAHDVRLDANDQRHSDEAAALPGQPDAVRCVDFASALAEILFVLPSRVARGRAEASEAGGA